MALATDRRRQGPEARRICRSPFQVRARTLGTLDRGLCSGMGFFVYWRVVFVYLHFRPILRLRNRNRSPARIATKPVRVRTAISSETGVESGPALRGMG